MATFIDGGDPWDSSPMLKIFKQPGKKYFARDEDGKLRWCIKGTWIRYTQNIMMPDCTIDRRELVQYDRLTAHGKALFYRIKPVFISDAQMSYHALIGKHLVEGIQVDHVINVTSGNVAKIQLSVDDLFVDEPHAIKSMKSWNDRTNSFTIFRISGRFVQRI